MKLKNIFNITLAAGLCLGMASCVDDIKFGSAFLDKVPGGDITADTVFNNAEYTRYFLSGIYSRQYYGLPYSNSSSKPYPCDPYTGKNQLLTDCWQDYFSQVNNQYYKGGLNSGYGNRGCTFEYLRSNVWEAVRAGWQLIEHIDNVPGIDDTEKARMKAEAKCLIAARYFDTFRFYGGLPIVKSSFEFDGSNYTIPRGTVEETVDFMVQLLDEAIPSLEWNYNADGKLNDLGRWTQAGAMALKCKVLQFAASPIFNADEPYDGGTHEAEQQKMVWYGNYDKTRWDRFYNACKEFFDAINNHGNDYYLEQAEILEHRGATTPSERDYRVAFRKAYMHRESHEILHSTRVMNGYDAFKSQYYMWHMWGPGRKINRLAYNPTLEYVMMFPWADGTPLPKWEDMTDEQKAKMFLTENSEKPDGGAGKTTYTRDPRLYETVLINGADHALNWDTHLGEGPNSTALKENGKDSRPDRLETWIGGRDAGTDAEKEVNSGSGGFATGFANNKYYLSPYGSDAYRNDKVAPQWCYIRLAEMYLNYAEAILQSKGDVSEALKWINPVRNRVGLKNLEVVNPTAVVSKEALLEELLNERVRELGFEDTRWFDIVRYKRGQELLTKPLHGLRIYRLDANGKHDNRQWFGEDQKKKVVYPTKFEYERFELGTANAKGSRNWWTSGFDAKWYLQPFPRNEVNKGYGLVQNPGWE